MRKFSQISESYKLLDFNSDTFEQEIESLPLYSEFEVDTYLVRIGSDGSYIGVCGAENASLIGGEFQNFDETVEYTAPIISYLIMFDQPHFNTTKGFNWFKNEEPIEIADSFPIQNLFEQIDNLRNILTPYQKDFFVLINESSYAKDKNTDLRNGQFRQIRIDFVPRDPLTLKQAKQMLNI